VVDPIVDFGIVRLCGFDVMVTSGLTTRTVTSTNLVIWPAEAVTLTTYDPRATLDPTLIVRVEDPDPVSDAGVNAVEIPLALVAERATVPENPVTAATVIVELRENA